VRIIGLKETYLGSVTRALRLEIARELRTTKEVSEDLHPSPLLNLISSNVSIGFSLLQFAEMLHQLNKPGSDDACNVAEKVYAKSILYARELPAKERTAAMFNLGRLRTALDEFRSS
jgi:hypothetical protein